MKNILEQRDAIGNNIFDEVIIKKHGAPCVCQGYLKLSFKKQIT